MSACAAQRRQACALALAEFSRSVSYVLEIWLIARGNDRRPAVGAEVAFLACAPPPLDRTRTERWPGEFFGPIQLMGPVGRRQIGVLLAGLSNLLARRSRPMAFMYRQVSGPWPVALAVDRLLDCRCMDPLSVGARLLAQPVRFVAAAQDETWWASL